MFSGFRGNHSKTRLLITLKNIYMIYNVYFGGNHARKTGMSRKAAIEHYNKIKQWADKEEENVYIYCPTGDFYVSDYFLKDFLDLEGTFGKLMFDDGAMLLAKEGDDSYRWNRAGEILISTPKEIKHVKYINS